MADQSGYRLSLEPSFGENQLVLSPRIAARPGETLRYEIVATKVGRSGKSNTSQSGRVVVDASGSALLSTLRLGVVADDRCSIAVKVFDGQKLVAEQTLQYPQ